jgi:hypothetical protein
MMITIRAIRPLWWILLVWVGLVFLEGLSYAGGAPARGICQSSLCGVVARLASPVALFTGLMMLFGALLSVAFIAPLPARGVGCCSACSGGSYLR